MIFFCQAREDASRGTFQADVFVDGLNSKGSADGKIFFGGLDGFVAGFCVQHRTRLVAKPALDANIRMDFRVKKTFGVRNN